MRTITGRYVLSFTVHLIKLGANLLDSSRDAFNRERLHNTPRNAFGKLVWLLVREHRIDSRSQFGERGCAGDSVHHFPLTGKLS